MEAPANVGVSGVGSGYDGEGYDTRETVDNNSDGGGDGGEGGGGDNGVGGGGGGVGGGSDGDDGGSNMCTRRHKIGCSLLVIVNGGAVEAALAALVVQRSLKNTTILSNFVENIITDYSK